MNQRILSRKCMKCGKTKKVSNYTSNPFTKEGLDIWCKSCKKEYIKDLKTLQRYLEYNYRPLNEKLWNKCMIDSEKYLRRTQPNKSDEQILELLERYAIGYYLKQQNLSQYKLKEIASIEKEKEKEKKIADDNLILGFVEKWGDGYSHIQYIQLEKFEKEMLLDYVVETASHKDYLKKICKISLKMDMAIDEGNISDFEKLSKQYDSLMKSAKFTAQQRTQTDDTGGLNTFSDFYRLIEEEGFIPVFPQEERDLVDKTINIMQDYVKRIFMNDPQIISEIELFEVAEEDVYGEEPEE